MSDERIKEADMQMFLQADQATKDRYMFSALLDIRENCAKRCAAPPVPQKRMNPALVGSATAAALVGFVETLKALVATK